MQMQFENRQPPEGINISKVNPLTQFFKFLLGLALLISLLVVFAQVLGGWAAKHIPFRYEQSLMEQADIEFDTQPIVPELQAYLSNLAARIAEHLPNAAATPVQIHYSNESVFNAYATLGGHVTFYRGLLRLMPNENALAMVMAHEMAHVTHRDPVVGLGGGLSSMMALVAMTGSTGGGSVSDLLMQTGALTSTQFSRSMESTADAAALQAVNVLYGHVNGADELFLIMSDYAGDNEAIPDWLENFMSTHPLSSERVDVVTRQALVNDWETEGEITPLPAQFTQWLKDSVN